MGLQTCFLAEDVNLGAARRSTISPVNLTPDPTAWPMSTTGDAKSEGKPYEVAPAAPRGIPVATGNHEAAHTLLQQPTQVVQSHFIEPGEPGATSLQEPLYAANEQLVGGLTGPNELTQRNLDNDKKDWVKCDHCPKRKRLPCEMKYATLVL